MEAKVVSPPVKHPYMSGTSGLVQAVSQFRKQFPAQISADTLRKLGIAPNNESFVLNILRFIGVIDSQGKKTADATTVFSQHEDSDFQEGLANLVRAAYQSLFDLHGDDAWTLPSSKLISFFRSGDQTSAIVGQRQASTFAALAMLSGHSAEKIRSSPAKGQAVKAPKQVKVSRESPQNRRAPASVPGQVETPTEAKTRDSDIGITVRVEVNLPAGGDQDTYDRIFKSIRENLINGRSA